MSGTHCETCPASCSMCTSNSVCTACVAGNNLTLTGGCIPCDNCGDPLRAEITSPYDHRYKVQFNRDILQVLDNRYFFIRTDPQSQVQWNVIVANNEVMLLITGGPWSNDTRFTVEFTHPTDIYDEFGNHLSTVSVQLPPPLNSTIETNATGPSPAQTNLTNQSNSNTSSAEVNATITTLTETTTSAVAGGAVLGGVVFGGAGLAVNLLNQMQYFSYLGATGVQMPGGLDHFFSSMNQKSSMPNFFSNNSFNKRRRLNSSPVDEGEDFLDNAGQLITVLIIIVGCHGGLKLLTRACGSKTPKWLKLLINKFEWSLYLYFWCFAYLDLGISAFTQLKHGDLSVDHSRGLICTLLAGLVAACLTATPPLLFLLINRHRDDLMTDEDSKWKQGWGPVVSRLRRDIYLAPYFYPISYTQRLFYAAFLIFLSEEKYIQCIFLIFPPLLVASFVVWARPMEFKSMRLLQICAEVETFLIYLLICILTMGVQDSDYICYLIVSLTVKSLCCLFAIVIINISIQLKSVCCRKHHTVVLPSSKLPDLTTSGIDDLDKSMEVMKPRAFEKAIEDAPVVWQRGRVRNSAQDSEKSNARKVLG